jgi:hypothetical protein
MKSMKNTQIHWLLLPALLSLALMCSSCQLLGVVMSQVQAAQKIKPVYVPQTKGKKVLVFVDDRISPVSYQPIKRLLTDKLNTQLVEHKIAGEVLPYERLLDLMTSQRKFDELTVVEVGKLTEADLVLYVDITAFQLKEDSEIPLWDGKLETAVRWIDVNAATPAGAKLWPVHKMGGYAVPAVTVQPKADTSANYSSELATSLAEKMADQIAKLFYEHEDAMEPLLDK